MKSFHIERAAHDFLITLVFDKLFERFPGVRVASVENGADFLRDLFKKLTSSAHKMPGYYTEDPAETFRRNIWINPFWEDDVHEVVEHMGADRVIFGSDWPHIEGMPRPLDYAAELKAFDDDDPAQDPARQRARAEHASPRLTQEQQMADAATIASLATAVGTLVLAVATFASTRSANHSARIAERALDLNLRPLLIPAHEWEPTERITFHDEIVELRAGYAAVEERSNGLYFAAQLRNVGAGIGVLTSWKVKGDTNMDMSLAAYVEPPDPTHFVAPATKPVRAGRRRRLLAGRDSRRRHRSGRRRRDPAHDRIPRASSRCSCATPIRTAVTTRSPATRSCPTRTATG